jgi:colicin import membrane protein
LRKQAPRQSTWPGFFAALAMHAALIGYLWFAVQWRTSAVAPPEAVLWDLSAPVDVVQLPPPAPPAPVEAPPPPPKEAAQPAEKPDIVEKAEKIAKKEPEAPRKETPARKDKAKPSPTVATKEQARQAERQHVEEMARLARQAGVPGETPLAAAPGRLTDAYIGRVRAAVLANVHYALPEENLDVQAEYEVELVPGTGEVVGEPRLLRSSGLPGWDEAVRRAILHTDPFPLRDDGTAPRSLRLVFRPTDTR